MQGCHAMMCPSSGAEWATLNTAQKQLRRDMKLLYGTPRGLLTLRIGFSVKGKSYESLFALQVQRNSQQGNTCPASIYLTTSVGVPDALRCKALTLVPVMLSLSARQRLQLWYAPSRHVVQALSRKEAVLSPVMLLSCTAVW